jgi:hypothetical protein
VITAFTRWIAREFPELGPVDPRVVTIAIRCYATAREEGWENI